MLNLSMKSFSSGYNGALKADNVIGFFYGPFRFKRRSSVLEFIVRGGGNFFGTEKTNIKHTFLGGGGGGGSEGLPPPKRVFD